MEVNVPSDSSEDEEGKEIQTTDIHSDITAFTENNANKQDTVDKAVGCLQKEMQQLIAMWNSLQ